MIGQFGAVVLPKIIWAGAHPIEEFTNVFITLCTKGSTKDQLVAQRAIIVIFLYI